jgi:hypothetical protein
MMEDRDWGPRGLVAENGVRKNGVESVRLPAKS